MQLKTLIAVLIAAPLMAASNVVSPGLRGYQAPANCGSSGQFMTSNGDCTLAWSTQSPTNPGGSGTQLQYRSGSSFGGIPGSSVSGSTPTVGGLVVSNVPAGAIPYADASGNIVGKTTDMFWDPTNHFLGFGTITPTYELEIRRNVGGSQVGMFVENNATNGDTVMKIANDVGLGLIIGTAGTTFSAPYSGNGFLISDADFFFSPAAGKTVYTYPAGRGFGVSEGSNAKMGTFTLSSGAAWVANTSVTASSRIFLTIQTKSGTSTGVGVTSTTVNVGFNAFGAATDNSTVAYLIFEAK